MRSQCLINEKSLFFIFYCTLLILSLMQWIKGNVDHITFFCIVDSDISLKRQS